MIRTGLAVAATTALFVAGALAQQQLPTAPLPPDFSKVGIKTTDLGDGVYMLEGAGGRRYLCLVQGRECASSQRHLHQ